MLDPASDRAPDQAQRLGGVVVVVAERVANRFGDDDLGGEMGDRVDPVLADQSGDQRRIAKIADHQLSRRLDRPGEAGRQIVEHNHVFAGVDEAERHMAADIACPAGDQNRHRVIAALAGPRSLLTNRGRSASHGRRPVARSGITLRAIG